MNLTMGEATALGYRLVDSSKGTYYISLMKPVQSPFPNSVSFHLFGCSSFQHPFVLKEIRAELKNYKVPNVTLGVPKEFHVFHFILL